MSIVRKLVFSLVSVIVLAVIHGIIAVLVGGLAHSVLGHTWSWPVFGLMLLSFFLTLTFALNYIFKAKH